MRNWGTRILYLSNGKVTFQFVTKGRFIVTMGFKERLYFDEPLGG